MSSSRWKSSRARFLSSLFLVVFSVTVLLLVLNQFPSLSAVARPALMPAANSTYVETSQPPFQQPTVIVVYQATTTTETSTALSTLLSTTTQVNTSTLTQSLTQTETTISIKTSTAGLAPGLDPSLNIPILAIAIITGAVIGLLPRKIIPLISEYWKREKPGRKVEPQPISLGQTPIGAPGVYPTMVCAHCGQQIGADERFCTHCGKHMKRISAHWKKEKI